MPQPGPSLEGFVQARHFADPDRFPPHLLGGYKDSLPCGVCPMEREEGSLLVRNLVGNSDNAKLGRR